MFGFATQDNPFKVMALTETERVDSDRMFGSSPFEIGIPSNFKGPIHIDVEKTVLFQVKGSRRRFERGLADKTPKYVCLE